MKISPIFLLLPLMALSNIAVSADLYTVEDLDVVGVSLGDDAEEVIKGLTEYLSISRDDLIILIPSRTNRVSTVTYVTDKISLTAYLEPKGDSSSVLNGLSVTWLGEADYEAYVDELKEKYGPASIEHISGLYSWCEKVESINGLERCALQTDILGIDDIFGDVTIQVWNDYIL